MTNEEINAAIAKQRGEFCESLRIGPEGASGSIIPESFPNYCGDWAAAGPLIDKMLTEAILHRRERPVGDGLEYYFEPEREGDAPRLSFYKLRGEWGCRRGALDWLTELGDTPTEAIARAYYAAFCKEPQPST